METLSVYWSAYALRLGLPLTFSEALNERLVFMSVLPN
jgi:hypothetical protein